MDSAFSEEIRKPWRNTHRQGLSRRMAKIVSISYSLVMVVVLVITWGPWLEASLPYWALSFGSSIVVGGVCVYCIYCIDRIECGEKGMK